MPITKLLPETSSFIGIPCIIHMLKPHLHYKYKLYKCILVYHLKLGHPVCTKCLSLFQSLLQLLPVLDRQFTKPWLVFWKRKVSSLQYQDSNYCIKMRSNEEAACYRTWKQLTQEPELQVFKSYTFHLIVVRPSKN